jgi:protease-4
MAIRHTGNHAVSTAADKIYCNPKGGLDWRGFSAPSQKCIEEIEIEAQVFYDGKFKSAQAHPGGENDRGQ